MDSIATVKAAIYAGYKEQYDWSMQSCKECLALAINRRHMDRPGWAADWLERANGYYTMALVAKKAMKRYAN